MKMRFPREKNLYQLHYVYSVCLHAQPNTIRLCCSQPTQKLTNR